MGEVSSSVCPGCGRCSECRRGGPREIDPWTYPWWRPWTVGDVVPPTWTFTTDSVVVPRYTTTTSGDTTC